MTVVGGVAMAGMAMTAVPAGFAMPDGTETAGGAAITAARTGSDGGSEGAARASSGSGDGADGGAARAGSDGGGGRAE